MSLLKVTNIYIFSYIFISSCEHQNLDEDVILETKNVVKNIINNLFLDLGFKNNSQELKEKFLIHNYFTNISLIDNNAFKVITKFSRVSEKNVSELSTFILNKIFSGNHNQTKVVSDKVSDKDYTGHVEVIIDKIDEPNNNSLIEHNNTLKIKHEINSLMQNDKFFEQNGSHAQQVSQPERRIFKGQNTKIEHFPFLASIHMFSSFRCAGSIIKSDLIITAASCLQLAWDKKIYRDNPSFVSVRVGSKFFNRDGETILVREIHFHPGYKSKHLNNNLAILRLDKHIQFKKNILEKIDVSTDETPLPTVTKGFTLIGWGAKRPGNILVDLWSNRLSYSVLDIYDLEECEIIYSRDHVTRGTFCAGFVSKGSGACDRDVGDPGVLNGILVGVVSFGAPVCGTPDVPTVFTSVGHYANWIDRIMEQEDDFSVSEDIEESTHALVVNEEIEKSTLSPPSNVGEGAEESIEMFDTSDEIEKIDKSTFKHHFSGAREDIKETTLKPDILNVHEEIEHSIRPYFSDMHEGFKEFIPKSDVSDLYEEIERSTLKPLISVVRGKIEEPTSTHYFSNVHEGIEESIPKSHLSDLHKKIEAIAPIPHPLMPVKSAHNLHKKHEESRNEKHEKSNDKTHISNDEALQSPPSSLESSKTIVLEIPDNIDSSILLNPLIIGKMVKRKLFEDLHQGILKNFMSFLFR